MILSKKIYDYFSYFIINLSIILSININPQSFFNSYVSLESNIINITRFCLPSILLILFIYIKKIKIINYFNSGNKITGLNLLLIFYLFLLIISFISDFFNPYNFYFIIYGNIFLFVIILKLNKNKNIFFYNFIFLIFCYFFLSTGFYIYEIMKEFQYEKIAIIENLNNLRSSAIFRKNHDYIFNNPNFKSTGFARIILIIIILNTFLFVYSKKRNIINFLFITFLMIIIYKLQSKFAVYALLIYSFILFILFKNNNFLFFKKILITIIILFPLYTPFINTNFENRLTSNFENQHVEINSENFIKKNTKLKKINNITTGRFVLWIKQIDFIKERKKILGYGVMADHKLFGISSSNGFIYTILSGGLGFIIIFLLINIYFVFYITKQIIKNNGNLKNIFSVIIIVMLLRSLIENSFYSIPFDLFIILLAYELSKQKKNFSFFEN